MDTPAPAHAASVPQNGAAGSGDTIVSGSGDMTLKIWDMASGTCKATLEGHRYLSLFTPLRGEEA
jgi:WD40 repeat protein